MCGGSSLPLPKRLRAGRHGQRGHIEGLRVGRHSKMSLLVVLQMFTDLLRHFCAGMGSAFSAEMCL